VGAEKGGVKSVKSKAFCSQVSQLFEKLLSYDQQIKAGAIFNWVIFLNLRKIEKTNNK